MVLMKKYLFGPLILCFWGFTWFTGRPVSDLGTFLPGEQFNTVWTQDGAVEQYGPENLFQYIDGEAEMYNDYGFVAMVTAYYVHSQRSELAFSIDIYDMGSPLNAFGIYSMYRRPELEFASIGAEAIVSGTNIRFYKDRYFVQVNTGNLDSLAGQAIRRCARAVADDLPEGLVPAALAWMPGDHRVEHSLAYKTTGFMGQESIHSVLQAEYQLPSGNCTGFLAWFETEAQADSALQSLAQSLAQQGTVSRPPGGSGETTLLADTRFQGHILVRRESCHLAGVTGYGRETEARALLQQILASSNTRP